MNCSDFGNGRQSHFREKVGFVSAGFAPNGKVFVAKDQPFLAPTAAWAAKWQKVWGLPNKVDN